MFIHTIDYSAIKGNEVAICIETQMNLENMSNEKKPVTKDQC